MEVKQSEVEKLDVNRLPNDLRRQLLEAAVEMLKAATDPGDIECFKIGIEKLKASFD